MKDNLSQKKKKSTWKYNNSSNVQKRLSFQKKKKLALEYDVFYIMKKDGIFFPKNIFFYGRKMKDNISQKLHGNMMFSVCC